jgi:hypothetical protein
VFGRLTDPGFFRISISKMPDCVKVSIRNYA